MLLQGVEMFKWKRRLRGSADILMSGKREERMADASSSRSQAGWISKAKKNLSETVFFSSWDSYG